MGIQIWLAALAGVSALAAAPAAAQPDFASAFARLDRNGDGLLTRHEFTFEGVDAARYTAPVGRYETKDGFGVELWRTPFGVREASMTVALMKARELTLLRTFPRDLDPMISPPLMIANNEGLRTMSLRRFEESLRQPLDAEFSGMDANSDGGVSTAELEAALASNERPRSAEFQSGAGGDAMRARKRDLILEMFAGYDLDRDGRSTKDEILESRLDLMVGAYAFLAPR